MSEESSDLDLMNDDEYLEQEDELLARRKKKKRVKGPYRKSWLRVRQK